MSLKNMLTGNGITEMGVLIFVRIPVGERFGPGNVRQECAAVHHSVLISPEIKLIGFMYTAVKDFIAGNALISLYNNL